jgi:hypothetical protein
MEKEQSVTWFLVCHLQLWLSGAPLGQAPGLAQKIRLGWKGSPWANIPNLIKISFITLTTGGNLKNVLASSLILQTNKLECFPLQGLFWPV